VCKLSNFLGFVTPKRTLSKLAAHNLKTLLCGDARRETPQAYQEAHKDMTFEGIARKNAEEVQPLLKHINKMSHYSLWIRKHSSSVV